MLVTATVKSDLDSITEQLHMLVDQLKGKSVLIIGSSGFFGKWLCLSLCHMSREMNLSLRICGMSRNATSQSHLFADYPEIKFENRDIFDIDHVEGFDFVIHAATPASEQMNREQPMQMFNIAFEGTKKVVDWAVAKRVRRLLFTSSGAVYGPQPENISQISEDFLGGPDVRDTKAAYGEAKRAAELYCRVKTIGTETEALSARCFAFVGPWLPMDTHFAVGNFMLNAQRGQPIVINGDGTPRRSYMYTSDLTVWLLRLLVNGERNQAYNVGSDHSVSIHDIAVEVQRVWKSAHPIVIKGQRAEPFKLLQYVPSIEFAKRTQGLKIQVPFETALVRTMNWMNETNLTLR